MVLIIAMPIRSYKTLFYCRYKPKTLNPKPYTVNPKP